MPPVVHVDDDILQPDLERLDDELDRLRDELAIAHFKAASRLNRESPRLRTR